MYGYGKERETFVEVLIPGEMEMGGEALLGYWYTIPSFPASRRGQ